MSNKPDILAVGPDLMPTDGTIVPSGDYKATDPDITNDQTAFGTTGADDLTITVVITAQSGSGNTLTVTIQGWDPASSTWVDYLVSAALTGGAQTVQLYVSAHMTAVTNVCAQKPLARKMRVKAVGTGTRTTLTYSIGAILS